LDDALIVKQSVRECCKVAGTHWDGPVPPEILSWEGALIRRADVRSE
jgi:hypothetical protein